MLMNNQVQEQVCSLQYLEYSRDPGTWNLVSMLMNHEVQEQLWSSIQEAFKNVLVEVKNSDFIILCFERSNFIAIIDKITK